MGWAGEGGGEWGAERRGGAGVVIVKGDRSCRRVYVGWRRLMM